MERWYDSAVNEGNQIRSYLAYRGFSVFGHVIHYKGVEPDRLFAVGALAK